MYFNVRCHPNSIQQWSCNSLWARQWLQLHHKTGNWVKMGVTTPHKGCVTKETTWSKWLNIYTQIWLKTTCAVQSACCHETVSMWIWIWSDFHPNDWFSNFISEIPWDSRPHITPDPGFANKFDTNHLKKVEPDWSCAKVGGMEMERPKQVHKLFFLFLFKILQWSCVRRCCYDILFLGGKPFSAGIVA